MQDKVTCTGHVLCKWKRPLARQTIHVCTWRNWGGYRIPSGFHIFTKYTKLYTLSRSERFGSPVERLTPVSTHLHLSSRILHFHRRVCVVSLYFCDALMSNKFQVLGKSQCLLSLSALNIFLCTPLLFNSRYLLFSLPYIFFFSFLNVVTHTVWCLKVKYLMLEIY